MNKLIELPNEWNGESPFFLEGAILAANFSPKPLDPDLWLSSVLPLDDAQQVSLSDKRLVLDRLEIQYQHLLRNEYVLSDAIGFALDAESNENLADTAEGFMAVWPTVEEHWADVSVSDGSMRMLSALLTTLMLAIDEEQTQQHMRDAGIESAPALTDMLPQIDSMVAEVALAADEALLGAKAQAVNPYKGISRNDKCPCESGKKFKQCCGK